MKEIPSKNGKGKRGVYKCECGAVFETKKHDVDVGKSTSCGCVRSRKNKERTFVHGESGTKLYHVWGAMIKRCSNPNDKNYHQYGGRGVSVCEDWSNSYVAFAKWARENGYQSGLTLDRKQPNLGYSPDNCRWIPWLEQQNNRTNNIRFNVDGKEYTVAELSRMAGIPYATMYSRLCLQRGSRIKWTAKMAMETPKLTTTARRLLY